MPFDLLEVHQQCATGFLDVSTTHMDSCMAALHRLSHEAAWPFLAQLHCASSPSVPLQEELDRRIQVAQIVQARPKIPRQLGRERVFLHAFSGRRRAGDLQHYLEAAFCTQRRWCFAPCRLYGRRDRQGVGRRLSLCDTRFLASRSVIGVCTGRFVRPTL